MNGDTRNTLHSVYARYIMSMKGLYVVPHTNEHQLHQTINRSIDLPRTRSLFNVNTDISRV